MTTYYKAVQPNGTAFYDSGFHWLPEDGVIPEGGWLVEHPDPESPMVNARHYLSVSVVPSDCTSFEWPCRLLKVEPVGEVMQPGNRPNKRAAKAWRVVAELDPKLALGPNAEAVLAIIDRATRATPDDVSRLGAAWDAERRAIWGTEDTARFSAWAAARDATRVAVLAAGRTAAEEAVMDAVGRALEYSTKRDAWFAAVHAALAELVRDWLTPEQYDILTAPWRAILDES